MSLTTTTTATSTVTAATAGDDFRLAVFDLYRDIHKGMRAELFALTSSAGSLDPADVVGWMALAEHTGAVERMLIDHAHHEDSFIDPVLREHCPALAAQVIDDHERLDAEFAAIAGVIRSGAEAPAADRRRLAHLGYLRLSAFTSSYLAHQCVEEFEITPALEQAVGVEEMVGIHMAIIGSIPPDEMAKALAIMLPAMNADDRVELLGGMRAAAPPEAFAGVVDLARSVLRPSDFAAVAARMEL